jgi:outer membrane protein OmpA-like peptidoglycan-associated protein
MNMKKMFLICSALFCLASMAQTTQDVENQRCATAIAADTDLIGLILFPSGDTTPTAKDRVMMSALLGEVNRRDPAKLRTVIMVGHADQPGGEDFNMQLSLQRSKNVAAELLKLDPARTAASVVGCGQTNILVPQKAEGGHPHNRRVEIRLAR